MNSSVSVSHVMYILVFRGDTIYLVNSFINSRED
jgi:hypothetical protein